MNSVRHTRLCVFGLICLMAVEALAQRSAFLTGREPQGVDIQDVAMTPAQRKWKYPQSLYHFYRWVGDDYSNYARDQY